MEMEIKTSYEIEREIKMRGTTYNYIKWVRVDSLPKPIKICDVNGKLKGYSIELSIQQYDELSQSEYKKDVKIEFTQEQFNRFINSNNIPKEDL